MTLIDLIRKDSECCPKLLAGLVSRCPTDAGQSAQPSNGLNEPNTSSVKVLNRRSDAHKVGEGAEQEPGDRPYNQVLKSRFK